MKLFGIQFGQDAGASSPTGPAAQTAPGTEISYAPGLIAHFVDTHETLAALLAQLNDAATSARYGDATKVMHALKPALYAHLLEENVRLYTYLSYCMKGDADGIQLMTDMRLEMSHIGRDVTRFLKTYTEAGVDAGNAETFLRELHTVTEKLHGRLQREEASLYTLYQPPAHFVRKRA